MKLSAVRFGVPQDKLENLFMTARSSQQQLKTQHIHDGPQQPTAAEHPTYS